MSRNLYKILLPACFILCLASCSVLKKNKNIQKQSSEQKVIDKTETTSVKKTDIASEKRTDITNDSSSTVSLFFLPGFNVEETQDSVLIKKAEKRPGYFPKRANDYQDAPLEQTPNRSYKYVIGKQEVITPVKASQITITNQATGKVSIVEISSDKSKDSTTQKSDVVIQQKNTTLSKVKVSKSVSYLWIFIALGCCVAIYFIYQIPAVQAFIRPLLLLFRRRKKSDTKNNTA